MNPKFILIITFIYITLAFLGSTFEAATTAGGDWVGNTSDETLNPMFEMRDIAAKSESMGIEAVLPTSGTGFWSSIFQMVTLRFSFIVDDYEMIWYTLLLPIAVAGLVSIALIGTRLWEAITPFS
uniref:Uncharacterized protein n=1 Tax=viral metagenome TaxID=1070528 RepID=A0A6M3MAK7_9ZZZZ